MVAPNSILPIQTKDKDVLFTFSFYDPLKKKHLKITNCFWRTGPYYQAAHKIIKMNQLGFILKDININFKLFKYDVIKYKYTPEFTHKFNIYLLTKNKLKKENIIFYSYQHFFQFIVKSNFNNTRIIHERDLSELSYF